MLFDKSLFQKVLASYKTVFVSKQWPDGNGHFDIAVDQAFNCFFHLLSPFQL